MMKTIRSAGLLLLGAVVATIVVLACGDDGIDRVDAGDGGTCNCPAAEPPLAGRIVQKYAVTAYDTSGGVAEAFCVEGTTEGILLGGKCQASQAGRLDAVGSSLGGSPPTPETQPDLSKLAFTCGVSSVPSGTGYVVATAICLFPPAP